MDDDVINSIPTYIVIILLSFELVSERMRLVTIIIYPRVPTLIIYKYVRIHADRMIQPAIYSVCV